MCMCVFEFVQNLKLSKIFFFKTYAWYLMSDWSSSSSSQAGPEAYTSDAPQPRGSLCNPGSPLI